VGKILLIEDAPDGQLLVRKSLEGLAELEVAAGVRQAQALLRDRDFDLLIVDVELPDGNGFGLCSTLPVADGKRRPRILFLSGKGDLADKLTGFSVGGDDYLVKPVDGRELRARVSAQLRSLEESSARASHLKVGNLKLDLSTYRAYLGEAGRQGPVDLTPTEFKLLLHLARNEDRVFSREQLLRTLGGGTVHVTDRTIDAHLCRIRKKLLPCTHGVEPVYGIGYRFSRKEAA
jgi:DNA-binding response OmpR family regulator